MDSERLRAALAEADLPVLLMVLVHVTGERRFIDPPLRPRRDMQIFADESGGFPEDLQAEIRAEALKILSAVEPREVFPEPAPELIEEMMRICVADDVPPEYVPLLMEEMGFRAKPRPQPVEVDPSDFSV